MLLRKVFVVVCAAILLAAPVFGVVGTQTALLASDVSNPDGWKREDTGTSDLYVSVDESSYSDSDYIYTSIEASNTKYFILGLSGVKDPKSSSDHTLSYRTWCDASSGVTLSIALYQGAVSIKSQNATLTASTWVAGSFTLSSGEADSITDYRNLRVRVTLVDGGANETATTCRFSWGKLSVPNARRVWRSG